MSTSYTFSQVSKVVDTLKEKGVSADLLQSELLGGGFLADLSEAAVRGNLPDREALRTMLGLVTYDFTVDYSKSETEMIKRGSFDYDGVNISHKGVRFDEVGRGKVKLRGELIHFAPTLSSEEMLEKVDSKEYRPATALELLAFGAKNPKLQKQFPIVALGSKVMFAFNFFVTCLEFGTFGGYGSGRRFDLKLFDYRWEAGTRFLFIRK